MDLKKNLQRGLNKEFLIITEDNNSYYVILSEIELSSSIYYYGGFKIKVLWKLASICKKGVIESYRIEDIENLLYKVFSNIYPCETDENPIGMNNFELCVDLSKNEIHFKNMYLPQLDFLGKGIGKHLLCL